MHKSRAASYFRVSCSAASWPSGLAPPLRAFHNSLRCQFSEDCELSSRVVFVGVRYCNPKTSPRLDVCFPCSLRIITCGLARLARVLYLLYDSPESPGIRYRNLHLSAALRLLKSPTSRNMRSFGLPRAPDKDVLLLEFP
ncbi:hypothetical protein QR680_017452 [Steinernema hermaphroditum]|uniref:Uncharacterized protein n=1 Tax=Steinernema hermaphroditum TaxID=289476 RepID=A0AA39LPE2_9BILA|nr:hypothetical protein QR680_017452 [Steinernema hermaphroditum]